MINIIANLILLHFQLAFCPLVVSQEHGIQIIREIKMPEFIIRRAVKVFHNRIRFI